MSLNKKHANQFNKKTDEDENRELSIFVIDSGNFSKSKPELVLEGKVNAEKKDEKRETWQGKTEFFLSALAYAVGIGAVWRFPYLCYKNGGGVFLIPYFIFLILIGIPLVFLEMSVGQFTSTGPLTCWRMTPFFRGIGISMNIANGYLCIYYNMILAYSLYFLYFTFASIGSELPWQRCNSKWSSTNCFDEYNTFNLSLVKCNDSSLKCSNGACYSTVTFLNTTASCASNSTVLNKFGYWKPVFPSQDFWTNVILQKSDSIDTTGFLVWQLVLTLFIAWVFVYLMVVNGIKVSGKLIYFTALFPYLVLLILGIRGWTLPGADLGIKYYIYPDFSRLKDYTIWVDAAVQIFFTLSVAYGGMIALASYNTFHTNILRDAILVSVSNCFTCIFAGFVIFAYMGNLALMTNQDINDVVQGGQGLAYVVYPYAVTKIEGSIFWAFLFFIMMLVLGLDTMMSSVETMITSIFDAMPSLRKSRSRRLFTKTSICLCMFTIGLIFCTQSGTYWVEVFDAYSGNWAILVVACFECIAVAWFYGFAKFRIDISVMLGKQVTDHALFSLFNVFWRYASPLTLIGLVVFSCINLKGLELGSYVYPFWSNVIGHCLSVSTLSGMIFYMIYSLIDVYFINKRPVKTLFVADSGWEPLQLCHRALVKFEHAVVLKNSDNKNAPVKELVEGEVLGQENPVFVVEGSVRL